MTQIGYLGLGAMGSAMVRHLLAQGQEVVVWNRTAAAADELVEAGARRAETAAEALAAEVSLSMLANDTAAEAVLTAENLRHATGGVHVNMASVSPGAADRLAAIAAQEGVGYVAAPVLGRPALAGSGRLNILTAGAAKDIARAEPYLSLLGVRLWPFGDVPRRANVAKIAVNYNLVHMLQALGESVALVEANGIDASAFVDVLTNSLFGGIAYSGYGREIAERDYLPQAFSLQLGLKDLGLAESIAAEGGIRLASAPVLHDAFTQAMEDPELQDLDWAAVAEIARRNRA